jgi:hypothetical protein
MNTTVYSSLENFDRYEEESYEYLERVLGEFGLDVELRRFRESRYSGVGITRVLIALRDELLDSNSANLIRFYQACKRPDDDPHYEDLVISILISIICGVIANRISRALTRKSESNDEPDSRSFISSNIRQESTNALYYLLKATIVRELKWRGQLDSRESEQLLNVLDRFLDSADYDVPSCLDSTEQKIDQYMRVRFALSEATPRGVRQKVVEILVKMWESKKNGN